MCEGGVLKTTSLIPIVNVRGESSHSVLLSQNIQQQTIQVSASVAGRQHGRGLTVRWFQSH